MSDIKKGDTVRVSKVLYPVDGGFAIGKVGRVTSEVGPDGFDVMVGDQRVIATAATKVSGGVHQAPASAQKPAESGSAPKAPAAPKTQAPARPADKQPAAEAAAASDNE